MKIYISGRISGCTNYKEKFHRAAEEIRAKSHEAINPCDLDAILDPKTTSWEQYMLADLGLLRCCEALYLLPDWEDSRGARLEHREAIRLNLKIYKKMENIPENTKNQS